MIYMIYVDIKMFEKLVNNWLAYKMKKCGLWISSMVQELLFPLKLFLQF